MAMPSMGSMPRTMPPGAMPNTMASTPQTGFYPSMSPRTNISPRTNLASIPSTNVPSYYNNYGAANPTTTSGQAFPYAYPPATKPMMVPDASRDLIDGGYVYEGKRKPAAKGGYFSYCALLAVFLIPIVYFAAVYWLVAFQLRYYFAPLAWLGVLVLVGALAATAFMCFSSAMQDKVTPAVYTFFVCIGMFVALVVAMRCGMRTYTNINEPLYARRGLNSYSGIEPATADGAAFMDAGTLGFASGAKLDTTRSGGFMNLDMYCVAPIVSGTGKEPKSYDFWAVGLNCCTGNNDFQCVDKELTGTPSGLRLMSNSQQEFYKLAVQKAAAQWNMNVARPVFIHAVPDLMKGQSAVQLEAWNELFLTTAHFAMFMLFMVVFAMIAALWFSSRVK